MRIFVAAVAGTAMGSLAGLLRDLGHDVAGSDTAFFPPMGPLLSQWGIRCFEGFSPDLLDGRAHPNESGAPGHPPDLIVVGNVCRRDNPLVREAERLGIERIHLADALQRFVLPGNSSCVVTGTHGKTTTSSILAHLLVANGRAPGYLIGGVVRSLGRGFQAPKPRSLLQARPAAGSVGAQRRRPVVLEGDEYDTAFWEKTAKFLHYQAEVAVLTSVEYDHVDIYPTPESYVESFRRFIAQLPADGLLLAYGGDAQVVELSQSAPCELAYYGIEGDFLPGAAPHWSASIAEVGSAGTSFDLFAGGVLAGRFFVPLPGRHNVRNALAALATCAQAYGVPLRELIAPLASFEGVKRRQELVGEAGGVSVYDDFAHHPTAVALTLEGMRRQSSAGRLIAVFEPRSATACRRLHQEAYARAFDAADLVFLAPVGRELPESDRLDVPRLAKEISASAAAVQAIALPDVQRIIDGLAQSVQPGDRVVILSNGSFGGIHEKLVARLKEISTAQGAS